MDNQKLAILKASLKGDLHYDHMMRSLYATDASVYRNLPLAVALPKDEEDLLQLIKFAQAHKTSLIPRTAGTSLAGQCVGDGIVVDLSKHFNKILEVNKKERWVRVQPGVIRDELNHYLKPYGLFFGPNTSTANRAMIGGMVGNNSCGSYSIVYGNTRDHVLELKVFLSDGSQTTFSNNSVSDFHNIRSKQSLQAKIYQHLWEELSNPETQHEIRTEFPHPEITRRNTGYAIDELLQTEVFTPNTSAFNLCKLLTGSEGTLALTTEIKLNLNLLPPPETLLLCIHHTSIDEALRAVITAMKHSPRAVELMDKIILDCTKANIEQRQNRFFVQGDPQAILIIELGGQTRKEIEHKANLLEQDMKANGFGYHFPRVYPPNTKKIWTLRKAGLGVLANIPGDAKPVAVIEDTAVRLQDLPEYIKEFTQIMESCQQQSVYYAHAGAGELHLRPILNLKQSEGVKLFRHIGLESAKLVKKYKGSLSGEHGDGRVRAEFLPLMIGKNNYQLLRRIKQTWDPHNIFNPGKIVDAPPMDTSLRYDLQTQSPTFNTLLDFSETGGILRAAEKCNGSGDCRKLHISGGTLCPSYMATRDEKDTTRARANILREFLTHSDKQNPFNHPEIEEVMKLCLSCKGCKSECPSNVDMASLKAEFLYQYNKSRGIPFRSWAIANISRLNQIGAIVPRLTNFFLSNKLTSSLMKRVLGVAPQRSLPTLNPLTLKKWFKRNQAKLPLPQSPKGKVYLFADEFTNFNDVHIGIKAIELLTQLGYTVDIPNHRESGRAYISKGLLKQAQKLAQQNLTLLSPYISDKTPLIGIEPSAILTFRDEFPRFFHAKTERNQAQRIAQNTFLIDEFIASEITKGNITSSAFHQPKLNIHLHGHCHQKALSSLTHTQTLLSLLSNTTLTTIPSGCCGMAGSFGYEQEKYNVSMQIGELVLFPHIRQTPTQDIILALGTSCRHQIHDGTQRKAIHPIELLHTHLKP